MSNSPAARARRCLRQIFPLTLAGCTLAIAADYPNNIPLLQLSDGQSSLAAAKYSSNQSEQSQVARVAQATAIAADHSGNDHYSRNRHPTQKCANWTPNSLEVQFSIRVKSDQTGQGPEEVVYSMHNTSGCDVVARAIGKVIGTQGSVYVTSATPGQPSAIGFRGFMDRATVVPFEAVLSPNVQEYPAQGELDNIEVCSTTPPSEYPTDSYFDPFRSGHCKSLGKIGPVTFKSSSRQACGRLDPSWLDTTTVYSTETMHQTVQVSNEGLSVTQDTGDWNEEVQIPFGNLGQVGTLSEDQSSGTYSLDLAACTDDFQAVDTANTGVGQNNGWIKVLHFPNSAAADAARGFLLCHKVRSGCRTE